MSARAALLLVASLALFALPARAEAPPRAPRATLVEVLRGGKQVLVLDRATGDYAVMKLGDSIQGFRITSIEDDQMVLVSPGTPEKHFVIPLFDRTPIPPMKAPLASQSELADPYADAPDAPAAKADAPAAKADAPAAKADAPAAKTGAPLAGSDVLDPYGPADIPAVVAPDASSVGSPDASPSPTAPTSSPGASPAPTPAPAPSAPAPSATTPPSAAAPAPSAAAATPAPSAAPADKRAPRTDKRKLSRKELNKALSDFAALTREIKIERATGGGILVTDLAKGSFAARAGIEKGDVVRRVAGHTIDTVDDAASAYAAVVAAKKVVVEIDRRGARLHITYQLTD